MTTLDSAPATLSSTQHVILFYKYHPLSPDPAVTEIYRSALETLCRTLHLQGRILVGASETEGLNGTLAGGVRTHVLAFTYALLGSREPYLSLVQQLEDGVQSAVTAFWHQSREYFAQIRRPELRIDSPEDFKWSLQQSTASENSQDGSSNLFPDLQVKIVSELIGTGGVLSRIPLEETAQGYLTPKEWHQALQQHQPHVSQQSTLQSSSNNTNSNKVVIDDTIVIDCRNTKEYEIGHFVGAVNPDTTTFAQFPQWVDHHRPLLHGKKVFMYCTGGIRCEKASAYIRRQVPSVQQVSHLQGGIHKYLVEFGSENGGLWQGRNFVFDGRQAASAEETRQGEHDLMISKDGTEDETMNTTDSATNVTTNPIDLHMNKSTKEVVVGQCFSCQAPYDIFHPQCVCAVCREPVLTCLACQAQLVEFHCRQHQHLHASYFAQLDRFSNAELENQLAELYRHLEPIAIGRKFKQKRKTLQKQMDRISTCLEQRRSGLAGNDQTNPELSASTQCRNCGDVECTGRCWGFYGLKRKRLLEQAKTSGDVCSQNVITTSHLSPTLSVSRQLSIKRRLETDGLSLDQLSVFRPCSEFRDATSGIRVPPCVIRRLHCFVKAKWCGRSVFDMLCHEFQELSDIQTMKEIMQYGLLHLNGHTISLDQAIDTLLKNEDVVSRIVHWHEAPVMVPLTLKVQSIALPDSVLHEFGFDSNDNTVIYVCDKPASVPVHKAGPYFANTLNTMVEAQLQLSCGALTPLHRTDRVTSGLTLLCHTNSKIASLFQRSLTQGKVDKLYLALVSGKFPSSVDEAIASTRNTLGKATWDEATRCLQVDAPVETVDAANGIRAVSEQGKPSASLFQFLSYDTMKDSSLILCHPVTGRNHQLRVHLQWLGHAILGDVQYGGRPLDKDGTCDLETVTNLMKNAAQVDLSQSSSNDTTIEIAKAARQACRSCCSIRDTFTDAHLLQQGHAIRLHAWKYLVKFLSKKQRKGQFEVISESEYVVEAPDWADPVALKNATWLQRKEAAR
jgi:predicted sulfurtransferase/23S rRNA-/tRNA-specific pseudouridylate synthase